MPQIRKSEADTIAAKAFVTQSKKNLARAQVLAPFDGRIIRTMVDRGQRVGGSSSALADVYALDSAEIDLALSKREIEFLGFTDGSTDESSKIKVEVLDDSGEAIHSGLIDRSQGIVDNRTRLTNFIARIDKCFANPFSDMPIQEPLSLGQFVNLRLTGHDTEIFLLPDSAFRDLNTILVLDKKNGLRSRKVGVIHRADRRVWVNRGLVDGDRVCITPIEVISEGMTVRVIDHNHSEPSLQEPPKNDSNESQ